MALILRLICVILRHYAAHLHALADARGPGMYGAGAALREWRLRESLLHVNGNSDARPADLSLPANTDVTILSMSV